MLQRRLITGLLAAAAVVSGCAQADGTENGAIRENDIEPGLDAIDESRMLACSSEASSFRTVLEVYEVREGEPAPDEAALIAGDYVRAESELWDVVDGELVPQDPACGDVPTTIPAAEIVTDAGSGEALTVDSVLADFTDDDIASFGGPDCARQLAVVFAGASQYAAIEGVEPDTIAQVEAAGLFAEPVTMWEVVDDTLRPTADSACLDFVAAEVDELQAQRCRVEAKTLTVAREAYVTQFGAEPTWQDLVDESLVREPDPGAELAVELVDGVVRPIAGGSCDGIDLTAPPPPSADDCATQRRTLEVAIEAFFAQNGVLPATQGDLVASGLLRIEFEQFDLGDGAEVVAVPDGACG